MNVWFRSCAVTMAFVLWAVAPASAADTKDEFARRKVPPKRFTGVTFTEPELAGKTNQVEDNLLPKPSLGSIDQAIRKPFQLFRPEDSLDLTSDPGLQRLPPRPPSRQELRKRDVRENWVFSTPEEILGLPSAELLLELPEFGPNGEKASSKTSFERYLERREKERLAASTNQTASGPLPGWARPEDADESDKPRADGRSATEETTVAGASPKKGLADNKKSPGGYEFLPMGAASSWPPRSSAGDGLFNFNSASFADKPVAKDLAREQRMLEFRQLLDGRANHGPVTGLGAASPLVSPATITPTTPFPSSSPYSRGAASPPPSTLMAAPPAFAPVATTPSYLTPASPPAPAAPVTRPAPTASPFNSPFDLPRRKF